MKTHQNYQAVFWLIIIILAMGCGQQQTAESTLTAITIHPDQLTSPLGSTVQYNAIGTFSDNQNRDVTQKIYWSTSDSNVAAAENNKEKKGAVETKSLGRVSIVATDPQKGVSGTTTLIVTDPALTSITLKPAAASIHLGQVQQFKATGSYTDGSKRDITEKVTWSSPDSPFPTVSNTEGSKGLSISPPKGTITVTATDPGSGVKGTAKLSLSSTRLKEIHITPGTLNLPLGVSYQFRATGIYENGSTHNITDFVIWASAAPEVAAASNLEGEKGRIIANSTGKTTLKATDPKLIISGTAELTVGAARLAYIRIAAPPSELQPGKPVQLSVAGIYSDERSENLTKAVNWYSSKPAVADVDNDKRKGLLIPKAPGSAKLRAVDPKTGFESSVSIRVVPIRVPTPRLTAIRLAPAELTSAANARATFKAIGVFSNGEQKDISQTVNWSSTNTAIATVGNNGAAKAQVKSLAPGQTRIHAQDPKTHIKAAAKLIVTSPKLVELIILPASPSLALGGYTTLAAKGVFSDGSSEIMTNRVEWQSATPNVATVRNTAGAKGLINTKAVGASTITARDPVSGLNAMTSLTVRLPTLVTIEITPKQQRLDLNTTMHFAATGTYSNGDVKDITEDVTWGSSDETVAVIGDAAGDKGVAKTKSIGECIITATEPISGVKDTATLTGRADW